MADHPAFTPVNLITGFLGSGKTTLLQALLRDPALSDTAVLINEFGQIVITNFSAALTGTISIEDAMAAAQTQAEALAQRIQ